MENRFRRYSIRLIGLLFLLCSWVVACEQPAPSPSSPVPPPVQPSPAADTQLPEELPQVIEAANGEEWNTVETFSGKGNKTTPSFHVSGTEWRIRWTIDAEDPGNAVLNLVIHCQDKPYPIWQTVSHSSGRGGDVTYYIPYEGNRDFFIKVLARNLRNWTITIEDGAAEASLSNVQITRIRYKGTVYPRDPENCICFERVEPDEYVVIKNLSDCYQEMDGWVLKNITKGYPSFTFPSGFFLFPGQIIRVYTDETDLEHPELGGSVRFYDPDNIEASYCAQFTKLWLTFYYGPGDIWNNEEPDVAVLYNAKGEEVSRKSYAVPTKNGLSADE